MVDLLTIDQVGHRGDGVALVDGQSVFVPYALPGERVAVDRVGGHPDRSLDVEIERHARHPEPLRQLRHPWRRLETAAVIADGNMPGKNSIDFKHDSVALDNGDSAVFHYGDWTAHDQPITLDITHNAATTTQSLNNQT